MLKKILAGSVALSCLCCLFACGHADRYDYEAIRERRGEPGVEFRREKAVPESLAELPEEPLTLSRAVAMSLANNPGVDLAVARILQAEAAVARARAAFFPRVGVWSGLSHGDAPSGYLFKKIDQRDLPRMVNFNDPGWFQNFEVGAKLQLNVFNGFQDTLQRRMALTGTEVARWGRAEVENALASGVIEAYYNTLAAEEFAVIARESVSMVERQLDIMQVRYEHGGALKSDILSLKVRLAQSQEQLVQARNSHSLAMAALANLLGLPPDTPVPLKGEDDMDLHLPPDYASGVDLALSMRPELQVARQRVRMAAMGVDKARGGYLPRVDLEAKYWMADDNLGLDIEDDNYTGGIMLNWDLFAGGARYAAVDKAEAGLEEMLAADRKSTQGVLLDLRSAYLTLEEARARVEVTEASVVQAAESLRLVKQEYEGGSATITRYLDAELAYNRARTAVATARYDREKARAAVGRALGYCGRCGRESMREYERKQER
ncbi:MAG: TolC family protein [Desulfatibacillaceae bacterium]